MMSRVVLAVATGVGALHSTAGASLRSNGGRNLEASMYCNSIGCPGGYTPIANAWEVMCTSDPCGVSQCCEAYCSYHACPDGYIPIEDAWTTLCTDDECTDAQCCVSGDNGGDFSYTFTDIDAVFCNSIGCPDSTTPIPEAWETVCNSEPCESSQCCEAFCSYHACPGPYIPIEDAATTPCPGNACNDSLCCTSV